MADVFGLSDVSSSDTGRGKVLKTGGTRRKYNMKKSKGSASERLIDCMKKAKTNGDRRQCKVMHSIRSKTTKQQGLKSKDSILDKTQKRKKG